MQGIKVIENPKEEYWPFPEILIVRGIDISERLSFKTDRASVYYGANEKIFIIIISFNKLDERRTYITETDTLELNDYGEDFRNFAHSHAQMSTADLKQILLANHPKYALTSSR